MKVNNKDDKKMGVKGTNKVVKMNKQRIKKKVLGMKEVRVNLIRLTKETIERMMNTSNGKNTKNYNFSLKFNKTIWECTSHPPSIVPKISNGGTISISIRKPEASHGQTSVPACAQSTTINLPSNASRCLRTRPKKDDIPLKKPKPNPKTTISELSVNVQKKNLWDACKKKADKSALTEGLFVFAKQSGYAPWPSTIISINKSRTSAQVKYLGFINYKGTVKVGELVQVDHRSTDAISSLILFTLKTKAIKEFDRFEKAINEVKCAMQLCKQVFLHCILVF